MIVMRVGRDRGAVADVGDGFPSLYDSLDEPLQPRCRNSFTVLDKDLAMRLDIGYMPTDAVLQHQAELLLDGSIDPLEPALRIVEGDRDRRLIAQTAQQRLIAGPLLEAGRADGRQQPGGAPPSCSSGLSSSATRTLWPSR